MTGLRNAGQQPAKPCIPLHPLTRTRVASVRAEFIKSDPAKSPLAPVKDETTVPNIVKPIAIVEAKEKAAVVPPAPSQDALADLQHLKGLIETASKAQRVYEDFTQQQVDAIFKAAAAAASAARISLAVL